ncbi:hypothetical protein VHUM_03060 [Vanrija humicola]|uniref:gluconokinase n=1 Tax=Vanrija humicola TaxID=5417 RepID=A0A7D8YXN0_VANHU|nr:hypothetical protein VHUM_03060 [Vanrija humicola]
MVSGRSGKSTIGEELAASLRIPFYDGDDLHPKSNVDKMSAGHPLNDEDRLPWLKLIRAHGEADARRAWEEGAGRDPEAERAAGKLGRPAVVITCSALKKWYRDILRGDAEVAADAPPKLHTIFVYCKGSEELLKSRIAARVGHFMKPNMLASQLATLEDPSAEPGVVVVDIAASKEEVAERALSGTRAVVKELDAAGL